MKASRKRRQAKITIDAYARAARQVGEPDDTNVTDFLADLMHLYVADPTRINSAPHPETDPEQWLYGVLARAVGHYEAERRGEI